MRHIIFSYNDRMGSEIPIRLTATKWEIYTQITDERNIVTLYETIDQ